MRRLRIAIVLIFSALTLLCLPPATANQGDGWAVLLDEQANLQLSDVRSDRYRHQFSPLRLDELDAALPDQALWLHYRLEPGQQERLLRIFAPDLSRLDLYALDGQAVVRQLHHGRDTTGSSPTLRSSDHVLALPNADRPWTSTCGWSPNTSCARQSPWRPLRSPPPINSSPCCSGCCSAGW